MTDEQMNISVSEWFDTQKRLAALEDLVIGIQYRLLEKDKPTDTPPVLGEETHKLCPYCGTHVLWGRLGPKEYHDCKPIFVKPTDTPPVEPMSPVDPAPNSDLVMRTKPVAPAYRMLSVGEVIREGDEWRRENGTWGIVGNDVGLRVASPSEYRRRVVPDEKPVADGRGDAVMVLANIRAKLSEHGLPLLLFNWIDESERIKCAEAIIDAIRAGKVPGIYARRFIESEPHEGPGSCPTWYDGCNCTVDCLEHNIKRAEEAEKDRDAARAELDRVREDRDEAIRANDAKFNYMQEQDKKISDLQAKLAAATEHPDVTFRQHVERIKELEGEVELLKNFHLCFVPCGGSDAVMIRSNITCEQVYHTWKAAV